MLNDRDFFRCLFMIVILLTAIIFIGIITDLSATEMDIYLKAQRINNG